VFNDFISDDAYVAQVSDSGLVVWTGHDVVWLIDENLHTTKIHLQSRACDPSPEPSYVQVFNRQRAIGIRQMVQTSDGTYLPKSSGVLSERLLQSKVEDVEVGLPANHVAHCVLGPDTWLLLVSSKDDRHVVGLVLNNQRKILQTLSLDLGSKMASMAVAYDNSLGRGAVACVVDAERALVSVDFEFVEGLVLSGTARKHLCQNLGHLKGFTELRTGSRLLVTEVCGKVASWWAWLDTDEQSRAPDELRDVFHCDPACAPVLRELSQMVDVNL
jgi:hypothetical protein